VTRIIAGSRKGHRLRTPAHSATRPTTDRVREASFSLIADWAGTAGSAADEMLAGLSFLDLYAGSGGVALEAASRGAAPVVAVESDLSTARIARGNARETGLPVTVLASTVEKALAGEPQVPFDVVWADPPYALSGERLGSVLAAAADRWLAADGLLVLERSSRDPAPQWPSVVTDSWQRRYGETTLYFATKGR
jgi:16S rRNA (guanine966-N2)-methyltransferase